MALTTGALPFQNFRLTTVADPISAQDAATKNYVDKGSWVVDEFTASDTLDNTHYMAAVDATSGAVTITLPTAVSIEGKQYVIKKVDSSSNAVTIDGGGSETIDGQATQILTDQYASITVISDNANWHII